MQPPDDGMGGIAVADRHLQCIAIPSTGSGDDMAGRTGHDPQHSVVVSGRPRSTDTALLLTGKEAADNGKTPPCAGK